MKRTVLLARARFLGVCLTFIGTAWLASCESKPEINAVSKAVADSTAHNLVADDPPVKPSGPGGGP